MDILRDRCSFTHFEQKRLGGEGKRLDDIILSATHGRPMSVIILTRA